MPKSKIDCGHLESVRLALAWKPGRNDHLNFFIGVTALRCNEPLKSFHCHPFGQYGQEAGPEQDMYPFIEADSDTASIGDNVWDDVYSSIPQYCISTKGDRTLQNDNRSILSREV